MKRLFEDIKKHLLAYIIWLLAGLIIGITVTLIYYFVNDRTLYGALNGATVASGILIGFGILIWVGGEGAFDGIAYGFGQAFKSWFAKKANEMNDYASYVNKQKEKRKHNANTYWSLILAGLIFVIVMLILLFLHK